MADIHSASTDGHHDAAHHGADGHANHFQLYMYVFGALIVLTSCSFFAYSPLWPFHDTPWIGRVFMFFVSCCKALLVISFFMHLRWEANWKYVLTIPTTLMAIFLMIMLGPDIGFRWVKYSEERKFFDAEARADQHGAAGHQHEKASGARSSKSRDGKEPAASH
jgi:cytochrome c oxidase subunit 4